MGEPHWDQASRSYLGTILRTKDTGGTWDLQPIGGSETLKAVDFVDGSQGWAAGYNGTIVHTSDGGAHWVQQTVATRDEFRDLFFWDANQGWATSIHPSHYDSYINLIDFRSRQYDPELGQFIQPDTIVVKRRRREQSQCQWLCLWIELLPAGGRLQ
jgi:hypothetical protein